MGVTSLGRHIRPACTQGFTRSLKLCEECRFNSCVRVFFIPWGHVDNHDHIWAFVTSISHMGEMRDSDWSRQILLRSDWLLPSVALITTIGLYWEAPPERVTFFHRRTGCFLPGRGAVNQLPKKFLQAAQIFTTQSNRNEGRCNNIGRTGI